MQKQNYQVFVCFLVGLLISNPVIAVKKTVTSNTSSKSDATETQTCESFLLNQGLKSLVSSPESILELPPNTEESINDISVMAESYSLYDLFKKEDSLVEKRPFIVMNAAQQLLAMIYAYGSKRIVIPGGDVKINYYPIFSEGLDITKGTRVVGQYQSVSELVDVIKSQALGDRSGNSPALLIGPHGTGKSEVLNIIRALYKMISGQKDTPFASYTFEWKDLHKIPSLRRYIKIEKDSVTGEEISDVKKPEMNSSPYSILPPKLQAHLIEKSKDKVLEITKGLYPSPVAEADQKTMFIRDQVLLHYRKTLGKELSDYDALAILNNHVVIKRVVYGKQQGTLPTIEYQSNDIDLRGLFATPDVFVALDEGYGKTPMSTIMSGKIPGGHGNAILFDEILRNSSEFLNLLLGIFESRVIDIGGVPRTPFDSVIIAATNKANKDKLKKDPENHAQLDRFRNVNMGYSRRPHEILETLLYMKNAGLIAIPLNQDGDEKNSDEAFYHPVASSHFSREKNGGVAFRDIFPLPQEGQPVLGPDGRFRLWYKEGSKEIEISPHSLMLLAEIVAATRVVVDVKGYEDLLSSYKIIGDPVFKSPIARVLYNEGKKHLSGPQAKELIQVEKILSEGNTGISSRDASRLLTKVFSIAGEPENKNLVTPLIVLKALRSAIEDGDITAGSIALSAHWINLAERVSTEILLPKIESDIYNALAMNNSNVDAVYNQIWNEIKARFANPEATTVSIGQGRTRAIDDVRLEKIKKIYYLKTGRPLDPGQIAVAVDDLKPKDGSHKNIRHPGLEQAVMIYQAELETQRISIDDLLDVAISGEGTDEKKTAYGEFINNMKRLGYEERGAIFALDIAKSLRLQATQDEKADKK